jgi:hypothetical protein
VIEVVKRTKADEVLEHAAAALAQLDSPEAVPVLKEAAARDSGRRPAGPPGAGHPGAARSRGFEVLIKVLSSDPTRITREEALRLIQERTGLKLEGAELKKWWAEKGPSLKWKGENKRFE